MELRKKSKSATTPHGQRARKLLAMADRMIGAAAYVIEEEGDCEDNAWQLALALKDLCEFQGYTEEYCQQQFTTNLAIFLNECS